jgi:hypothetical protein
VSSYTQRVLTKRHRAALRNLECWLVDEEVVLWKKDASSSLTTQAVSHGVTACCTLEDVLATEKTRGNCICMFLTQSRCHADDARSLGALSVLLGECDSTAHICATIVSEIVRVRKARLFCLSSSILSSTLRSNSWASCMHQVVLSHDCTSQCCRPNNLNC